MGIAALLQNTSEESSFPLLKSIHYLGYFGIIHGITEWIIMIRIAEIFPHYNRNLLVLGAFTNGLSFVFLWIFGAKLLQKKGKVKIIIKGLPWFLFAVWFIGFLLYYSIYNTTSLHWVFVEDIMSRYFIGLPGALISAFALNKNAKAMKNLKLDSVALKLNGMAILFGLYGFFAGAIVDNKGFFPSNLLNKFFFFNTFGFPVELARASTALGITILFVGVIKVFKWEVDKKIERLTKQQIASQERRKLGQELHDVIIQNLFATGLYVENLIEIETRSEPLENLNYIKSNLNETIMQIRQFIGKVSSHAVEIEDLKLKLTKLINSFQKTCNIPIELRYNLPEITLGSLSHEKVTEIYYIIQEALSNGIKHANATHIIVDISTTLNTVVAVVHDNGKGFETEKAPSGNHYGLISMKERALRINGLLEIRSNEKGTTISITIPWEESENAQEKY